MTISAVASSGFASTAKTFTLVPKAVNDFILFAVLCETAADYATTCASSNVTWSVLVPHTTVGSDVVTIFLGKVTSTSSATVTITTAAGSPTIRAAGYEYSTTVGFASISLDKSATVSAGSAFPSITPTLGAGEMYFGYCLDSGTATAGSTSGYSYYIDANGNALAYNTNCTSSAQAPTTGDTGDTQTGLACMVYEATKNTLFNQATETGLTEGSTSGGTIGVHITTSAICQAQGVWLYSPSGFSLNAVPPTIGIYNYSAQTLVTSQAASWSGTFGTGWIYAAFTTPVTLSSGSGYMICAFDGSGTAGWFVYADPSWTSAITSGPITGVNNDGPQGWYSTTTGAISFPSTQLASSNWYIDVQVATLSSSTLSGAAALSGVGSLGATDRPKMSTLTDSFPGSTLNSTNWYVEPDAGSGLASGPVTVASGTLELSGGTYSDAGYYTSVNSQNPFDLTNSYAYVKIAPGESGTGDGDTGLGIYASNFSDGYNFDVTGGNLTVQSTVSDSPTTVYTVTYNATNHAWLRVREALGTLYFETAPDGSTWTTQYSTTTETVATWTARNSYVQFFYGSTSGASSPTGTANFQSFNTTPAISGAATLSGTGSLTAAGVFAGSASLSGTGSLTVAGFKNIPGAASISGLGSLAGTASKTEPGAASLSGTGSVTATGTAIVPAAASISGTGSLTATGQKKIPGAAALSGTGTMAGTGQKTIPGAASLSGTGTMAGTAHKTIPGAASVSGQGTLTAAGAKTEPGAASLSGTGSLAAAGTRIMHSTATLSGTGSMTSAAAKTEPGAATLSGTGSMTAAWNFAGSASLSGTGSLTSAGFKDIPGAAALSGTGAMTGTGQKNIPGAASLSGTGTVTAAGAKNIPGAASVSGTGSLTASAFKVIPGAASLSGTGTAGATGQKKEPGAAALSGTGTLTGTAQKTIPGAAALSGSGSLAGTPAVTFAGSAPLEGEGIITASSGSVTHGSAALSGSGSMSGTGQKAVPGAAALSGTGAMAGTAISVLTSSASLSGLGSMSGAASKTVPGAAALSGLGSAAGSAARTATGAASLSGTGLATVTGNLLSIPGSASLSGTGSLSAAGFKKVPGAAGLSGAGSLASAGTRVMHSAAHISGTGSMSGTPVGFAPGAAALSGSGSVTAGGYRITRTAPALAAQAELTALAVLTRLGAARLSAPGAMTAVGVIPERGTAAFTGHAVLFASAFNRLGEAALAGAAVLGCTATAGPDLNALWGTYQGLKIKAVHEWDSYRMMHQAGATDGTAGFMYIRAYEAERQADIAYKAYLEARERVTPGAAG